jgi:hypothetical protein
MRLDKITFIFIILVSLPFVLSGQTIESGNLICIHNMDVILNENITPQQFEDFMIKKYFPEFEKNMQGVRLHLLKGVRGEREGKYGIIMYFKNEATRDKYFPEEGIISDYGKKCLEKMIPMENELYKIAKTDYTMTQWKVL